MTNGRGRIMVDLYLIDLAVFGQCPSCGGNCYVYDVDEHGKQIRDTCQECGGAGCVVVGYKTKDDEDDTKNS